MSKELNNAIQLELNSLDSNVGRMCVCDTKEELKSQFMMCIRRLLNMHDLNMQRLREKELKIDEV